ncbi:MAG: DUF3363 domain-containing protein [Treponema sp.]|jgi:hypothetical protein|nr:DUF3363 domain-containing protein [Treponema sp.]
MRHFLFEEKEYQYRAQFKRHREKDSAQVLARALPRGRRSHGGGSRGVFGKSGRTDTRQRSVVKVQYSNSKDAHKVQLEYYLTREGTERDGSRARLYGTDITEYKKNMVDKNYRIFLSPQSDKADLTQLTRIFVKKLELYTGKKLYWQAANHYNTAHPHAHLLINGVDRYGNEVQFSKDLVKTFMREASRDILTRQLGFRKPEEIRLDKERELKAARFIKFDETIKSLCGGGFTIRISPGQKDRERIVTRLETLSSIGVCTYQKGVYKLSPRWEADLKANGRYNAFLDSRNKLRYSAPSSLNVYTGREGPVKGKVTKILRTDDDASDNHAVIVECPDGKSWFVPLLKRPEIQSRDKTKTPLAEGDYINLTTYKSQKGRLTPVIFKSDLALLKREVKQRHYTGALADEILRATAGTVLHKIIWRG